MNDDDEMSQAHVQVVHDQGQVQSKQEHTYDDSQVKYNQRSIRTRTSIRSSQVEWRWVQVHGCVKFKSSWIVSICSQSMSQRHVKSSSHQVKHRGQDYSQLQVECQCKRDDGHDNSQVQVHHNQRHKAIDDHGYRWTQADKNKKGWTQAEDSMM